MRTVKKLLFVLSTVSVLTSSLCGQMFCNASTDSLKYDLNIDGKVNSTDLSILKRLVLDMDVKVTGSPDINGDGKVNSLDYVILKKYLTNPVKTSDDVYKANTNFAFDIFKELNKEDADKNINISPISISTAVSMVYQGAGTNTKAAIANALRYKGLDTDTINQSYKELLGYLNQSDPKVSLSLNNSLWYRSGFEVNNNFLSMNKDVFGSYISSLDFSKPDAANIINGWISDTTRGKITSMISPPIPDDVCMYLFNAVYFNGQWVNAFDSAKSFKGKFTSSQNVNKDVLYMRKEYTKAYSGEFGRGSDYTAVRIPYAGGNIAMYAILPDSGEGINDFINSLDGSKWNAIKQSICPVQDLELTIPRFKVTYGIKSLKKQLSDMGMKEAFTGSADFSGICDKSYSPDTHISDVLHNSIVEVTEEGTVAAAVTEVIVVATPGPNPQPVTKSVFSATRPFVYVIADDKTGTILFTGKVSDIGD
ncbi:MAG TPA: serpin family protein [Clostridia bacterium]